MIQPYAKYGLETLEVIICDLPDSEMAAFIGRELEREHGNLQLDAAAAEKCSYPPLSALGRSLLATDRARELVKHLVVRSDGNILLSLLRLEHTRTCNSAEEAIPASDRLPAEIVVAFRAGITRVCASSRGDLGLDAIRIVAATRNYLQGMEWKKLQALLVERGWGSELGPEEVVVASRGFLKAAYKGSRIRCYHTPFALFAREGYDERLGAAAD